MKTVEFQYRGQGLYIVDESRWGDSRGRYVRAEVAERLLDALKRARDAGVYVVKLCESDLADSKSPNPMRKSMPHATLAHCYAAMNFLTEAQAAIQQAEEE